MPVSVNAAGEAAACPPDTDSKRWCPLCEGYLPFAEFYSTKNGGKTRRCRKHHARKSYESRQRTRLSPSRRAAYYRRLDLWKKYGITPEQYDAMYEAQGGLCAICHQPETALSNAGEVRALSVDHDRTTGQLRGLLCSLCNVGIGNLRHEVTLLRAAIAYLENYLPITHPALLPAALTE